VRRASQIDKEKRQILTVEDLTGVFESIASTQIAKVKSKVELSKQFFDLLWARYTSIRVDPRTRITSRKAADDNPKQVFLMLSAEAGLSGDIDKRLIETMLQHYDRATTDIVVLGSHGAAQLNQRGIPYIGYFKVPDTDRYIDVTPVIKLISQYSKIVVYYEEYVSLGVQDIKTIDLLTTLQDMSADAEEDVMTATGTIFEPSLQEIADQMETMMMVLALHQAVLESSLAQAASRFNAMAVAKKLAFELLLRTQLEFHRAKRGESDRRMREVMVSIKKRRKHAGEHRFA
jgi:F-type H+-transporting ATPase subunit gamma